LVVFDDFDFLPIIRDPAIFSKATIKAHVHLDIHEYRGRSKPLTTAWRYLTRRFYVWQLGVYLDRSGDVDQLSQ
jgi:hypothetical protein